MPMSCSLKVLPSTAALHHGTLVAGTGINKKEFLKEEQGVHGQMNTSYPGRSPSEHHVPSVLEND